MPDSSICIGTYSKKSNKVFLFNEEGKPLEGFPQPGCTSFSISDMNRDGRQYLVTGTDGNTITVYVLP
jgi:hypothetical protein